jgi:UDP:flavonoid glycosyltransferase YjiC (YdhE family)
VTGHESHGINAPFLIKAPFISFDDILPKVDVVVCHGGNGTIYQAMLHKVPVLCGPSHLEQTWNAQRVEELGYGQSIHSIHPDRIHAVICDWIEKKSRIRWDLDFDAFNTEFQNSHLLALVSRLVKM